MRLLHKFELSMSGGWYSGEGIKLVGFDLLHVHGGGAVCIIELQIFKLIFGIYLDLV